MKKFVFLLMPLLFAGCMNIDYVGKKFSPTEQVRFTEKKEDIPLDEYTLIGRFTVKARLMYHPYEVEDAIIAKAQEFGGDYLCLTENFLTYYGVYTANNQEFGAPDLKKRKISDEEKKIFGEIKPLDSKSVSNQRREYHYLLFKKTDKLNQELGY